MDDENNLDRSESTEENEDKSETETDGIEKCDSVIVSRGEVLQESKYKECRSVFQGYDNRIKNKRGPKPKLSCTDNETFFLVGMPRDQLKRKLMESVVEKIESTPMKKNISESPTSITGKISKRRLMIGQSFQSISSTSNVPNPRSSNDKIKTLENANNLSMSHKSNQIFDFSNIKVPVLPIENISWEKFCEDLIDLLVAYDPAEYFKYPLIDHFAQYSYHLTNQTDFRTIKRKLKEGHYKKSLDDLENDLLLLYSNGIHSFSEKSIGWYESAKLYQTALVNLSAARKRFGNSPTNVSPDMITKSPIINNDRTTFLNLLNPYNNGKLNDNERIITIGEQIGKLKTGTQNLPGYKEDRRNKVTVLSYLDYGSNFSFGPSYDSGNAYSSKETSDLLIRAYGDNNFSEDCQADDINDVIPEVMLGDDFSLYLMNIFTKDIIKSFQSKETKTFDLSDDETKAIYEDNMKSSDLSNLQNLLNDNWKDLIKLKTFNYRRLSNYQLQPTNDEQHLSEKVTANLTNLILKTNPQSVINSKYIRKALNYT